MRILVTGGAGFIGSNLILHLHENRPDFQILNLDKLSYASDLQYLKSIKGSDRYWFKRVNITNREAVNDAIQKFNPDGVIHLAAESHVDNSISGPEPFIYSNVVGTFNVLDECRRLWGNGNGGKRFLHVSTDEVYGTLGDMNFFTENTPYAPNSPYSASKAGSDFIVRSYFHTYGMNVITTNCSNNFGPHQHNEKLIPTVIRTALNGEPIPVYGEGKNIRDWLYVRDHCEALTLAFEHGKAGETYKIGGDNEWKNIELVQKICTLLNEEIGNGPNGDYRSLITFVQDRAGHDYRYAIDCSKIKNELGWKPEDNFESHLRETVKWYLNRQA